MNPMAKARKKTSGASSRKAVNKTTTKKAKKKKAVKKAVSSKQKSKQKDMPTKPSKSSVETQVAVESPKSDAISTQNIISIILNAFSPEGTIEQQNKAKEVICQYLKQQVDKSPLATKYNIALLYDETRMVQSDVDNIYSAVTAFQDTKPILFILHSTGGYTGPAYLIGKLLHEYSNNQLEVVVPRRAKSGATLLCCSANHIHMGSLSELGPIDPQFEGMPALGLKSAIQHIAELIAEYPHATNLFAKYMTNSIKPIHLGHYERVAESAVQYAERLLQPHKDSLAQSPEKIAKSLVYSYKDHGFVIDKQEAQSIFGDKIVIHNSKEYALGNAIYQNLVFISRIADIAKHNFYMIGSLESEPMLVKRKQR